MSTIIVGVNLEDPIQRPYVAGRTRGFHLPSTAYTPFRDFNDGDFVFVRLHGLGLVHIWMGRAQSDVVKDEVNAFSKW